MVMKILERGALCGFVFLCQRDSWGGRIGVGFRGGWSGL